MLKWILYCVGFLCFQRINAEVASLNQKDLQNALESNMHVFVKFYAPWCGHCKKMAPHWKKLDEIAASKFSNRALIAEVDCTKHSSACKKYGIKGYPTIKLFKPNQEMVNYKGPRDHISFAAFLHKHMLLIPTESMEDSIAIELMFAIGSFIIGIMIGFWFFCLRPQNRIKPMKYYSVVEDNSAKPGHGEIHESIIANLYKRPPVETLYDNFMLGVKMFPKNDCLGSRIGEDGNVGEYKWETYEQIRSRLHNFGAGLIHFNCIPLVDSMKMLGIYMKNSPEWVVGELGAYSCGGTIIPLYDTLGTDSSRYIINQTALSTILCSEKELEVLMKVKRECPTLKNVIISGKYDDSKKEEARRLGISLRTFKEVEEAGKLNPCDAKPGKGDSIATFMYTSGTTGDPKGAMLSHQQMMSSAEAMVMHTTGTNLIPFSKQTIHLSYLPLPHAYERTLHMIILQRGGRIGFYQGNPLKLLEDLTTLRPTFFPSVPRLLNKIYDKIMQGAESGSKLKAFLFKWALNIKIKNLKRGYTDHPLWDHLIFRKIRVKLGLDRCMFMGTGSAPISPDVLSFYRAVFGCPVVEGYGQTEAGCGTNITHINDPSSGTVGGPLPCCKIKLVSIPDMGYDVLDTTHGELQLPCRGRGEVCVKGPSVFSGYYKMPAKTAETIDEDGWLHTGDVGLWTVDGKLKIIDRKKNIFKLSQGEYVAPEKIENILVQSKYIAQAFVHGDSFHSHLVGIIVPDDISIKELAERFAVEDENINSLCENEDIRKFILEEIKTLSKERNLCGFEVVRCIRLHPVPFSVDNNILTPTFKLRRNDAKKAFLKDIEQMYVETGDSIAGKNLRQDS